MTTDKIKKYISRMAENLRLGRKGTTFLFEKSLKTLAFRA